MTILIRDLLNKLIWDSKEDIKDYVIIYIHRGALNDQRQIPAHLIEKVYVGSFSCTIDDEETIIPFHRILEIRNIRTQKVVYKKRS
ncbi:RNA repair domain-containing protein [Candidatus Borrarchaeum sp.]|uniref:RNA repair domain-containing protein n=1 Tax=Candidatus Borrarchaeum sp. TaxID=2846742 RepID=UPI00257A2FF3|nr:RNA repair domain-containing protein [Candidatus Borrarchaeum sp.]